MPIYNPPPTAVPTAHHTTHEVGGADLIANNAWTNQQNTFTVDQKFSGNLALGAAALGTTNVARTDVVNTFTADQNLTKPSPLWNWKDTAAPANAQQFVVYNTSQLLVFDAWTDASGLVARPLQLDRSGNAKVGADVYEKGRTTPLGHWISVPFNAANFTAAGGSSPAWTVEAGDVWDQSYTLIGKTLIYSVFIVASSVSGSPTELRVAIPSGFTYARSQRSPTNINDAGSDLIGYVSTGSGYLSVVKLGNVAFTNSTNGTVVGFSAAFTVS